MTKRDTSIAQNYSQVSAQGATPIGLIVSLFDQVIRDLRRAVEALDRKDIERRTSFLNHAHLVIAELQNVLDYERGGEPATRFENFYRVTRGMLLKAQIQASRAQLLEVIDLYAGMRQAWHKASQKIEPQISRNDSEAESGPSAPLAPTSRANQLGLSVIGEAERLPGRWNA